MYSLAFFFDAENAENAENAEDFFLSSQLGQKAVAVPLFSAAPRPLRLCVKSFRSDFQQNERGFFI